MNEDRITFDKIEKRKMIRNTGIFVILILVAILIVIFPEFKKEDISTVEFSAVDKICELSTLRCYYHDVAEYEKQPDGLFQYGLFKYGYKKFWIEYDGIVELGIDVDKVQVNQPDENNIVYVYVPDARIIDVNADKDTMSDPIVETGKFTSITTEEKTKAFSDAQKTMRENAEANNALLKQAKVNAMKLLEQYIVNVGQQMDQIYTVKWLDEPLK